MLKCTAQRRISWSIVSLLRMEDKDWVYNSKLKILKKWNRMRSSPNRWQWNQRSGFHAPWWQFVGCVEVLQLMFITMVQHLVTLVGWYFSLIFGTSCTLETFLTELFFVVPSEVERPIGIALERLIPVWLMLSAEPTARSVGLWSVWRYPSISIVTFVRIHLRLVWDQRRLIESGRNQSR